MYLFIIIGYLMLLFECNPSTVIKKNATKTNSIKKGAVKYRPLGKYIPNDLFT
jgi:hypothetical protein